ncbi:MAG TPA: ankyrin repeat domain-containing protein [Terriglobia bacterium]|nr:ankyrin repeat domain-containing protein [Terriglobia bacterium]
MSDLDNLIAAVGQGNMEQANAILDADNGLVNQKDASGATPIHYAAFNGHRDMVRLLVERGADVNSIDNQYTATPAGWAIEYLREMGGFLGIELGDFAYAIQQKDAKWVARFLKRFPALQNARDTTGTPFQTLARESGDPEIARLFGLKDVIS